MTEKYTLSCEKCGQPYISSDGFPRLQWCPSCSNKCPECKGEGWVPITVGNNDGGGGCHEEQDTCPSCHGTGRIGDWNIERLWIK